MQVTEILLFDTPSSVFIKKQDDLKINQRVVVSVNGGNELGIVKGEKNIDETKDLANFVRLATDDDNTKRCENCKYARTLLPEIKKEADKLGLNMKVGFISTNLDRSKIVVNYTSDERVDFRELIKVLANKYKTRIEMKQIGNRDESKIVGAIGICGRVTCCKSFLSDFDKVSIKMAKNQNIALNPSRINGMCGRLLCCLKYEDEFYEEMQKKMPKISSMVSTPDGVGKVTDTDFLREKVSVELNKSNEEDTTEIKVYDLNDIKKIDKK